MPYDQYEWQRWLETLNAQDWLQKRYPAPQTPQFPEFQGISGEQESQLLNLMRRETNRGTNSTLRDIRTNAASRGAFRSGQLQNLEAGAMKAGNQQYSDMLLKYVTGKANAMQGWNQAKAQYDLNAWAPLYQTWQSSMAGAGDIFGRIVR